MIIPKVNAGDPPSASAQNWLIQKVNELLEKQLFFNETHIGLFELTEDVTMPTGGDEHTPYAKARRVYCHTFGGASYRTYETVDEEDELDLWFPTCLKDGSGYGVYCQGSEGQVFWGIWNRQSARWEVITGPSDTVIGKLDGSLSQGGSATVSVWRKSGGGLADTGVNITAYDWLMKSGATAIASGKKVVCKLIDGTWYVTEAECP